MESKTAKITKPNKVQKPAKYLNPKLTRAKILNIATFANEPNIFKDEDTTEPNILVSSLRPNLDRSQNFENKSESEMIETAISEAIRQSVFKNPK